jgi:hypothetical protein
MSQIDTPIHSNYIFHSITISIQRRKTPTCAIDNVHHTTTAITTHQHNKREQSFRVTIGIGAHTHTYNMTPHIVTRKHKPARRFRLINFAPNTNSYEMAGSISKSNYAIHAARYKQKRMLYITSLHKQDFQHHRPTPTRTTHSTHNHLIRHQCESVTQATFPKSAFARIRFSIKIVDSFT